MGLVLSGILCAVAKNPLGSAIRDRRRALDLTQEQVAATLGIKQGGVSKWEKGRGKPELPTLLDLCAVLRIDVNHLVAGLSADYDRLGLTSRVIAPSTNEGTNKKGGAPDASQQSAQARIRELTEELDAIKTAIGASAVELSNLAGNERLPATRTATSGRRRKTRKTG